MTFQQIQLCVNFATCELSPWLPRVGSWWLRGSFVVPTKLLDYLSSTSTYRASIIIKTRPKIAPSHLGSLWGTSTNLQVGLYLVGCYTILFDSFGIVYGWKFKFMSGIRHPLIIVMFPLYLITSISLAMDVSISSCF
jgi:hypothetical protein